MDVPEGPGERLSFLHRPLSPRFERRVLVLEAGEARAYDPQEWQDALVSVEQGAIELECARGGRRRFEDGDVLFLADLPLVAIHNPGPGPAVLVAVSRRPRAT